MQPAFIRLLDNFRKVLSESDWQSHYEDIATWPEGTTLEQQQQRDVILQQLDRARPDEVPALEAALAALPEPAMAYRLNLSRDDQLVQFDLWQLCYQVCFQNYVPGSSEATGSEATDEVEIDETLLDDYGEVDWGALDIKVQQVVGQLMDRLPS